MRRLEPPAPEALRRIQELAERRLTAAELEAWVNAPMSDAEREETLELIRWFMKRYPTPGERLAAARRAYAQWTRTTPSGEGGWGGTT